MHARAARDERSQVARLLDEHVVEIAHHADAVALAVAGDRGGVGHLTQEESLLAVQRLQDHARAGLQGVLADGRQRVDEYLANLLIAELRLSVEGGHENRADRADGAGGRDESFKNLDGLDALAGLLGNHIAVGRAPANRADLQLGFLDGVDVFLFVADNVAAQFDGVEAPLLHPGQLLLQVLAGD